MSGDPRYLEALQPLLSRVRRDICWKKTPDGPRRISQELTDARILQHVNGGPAYGAAPIVPGQSVTLVAVLDLDSHKGETPWSEMQDAAARILEKAAQFGFEGIPFRSSGGHGMHLYFVWEKPQDAYSVRYGMKTALEMAGLKSGTKGLSAGEVEIFPKQNSVPADKFGNMFILPLAGASVPLCPLTLEDLAKEDAIGMDWPLSRSVPYVDRPETNAPMAPTDRSDLDEVRVALAAIPNTGDSELGYDDWRNVVFALHSATGGDADGLALAHEFSARSSKYDAAFLDNRVWPYVKADHNGEHGGVTVNTLFRIAKEHGWVKPIPDDFEALPALVDETGVVGEMPKFRRTQKGALVACLENLSLALRGPRLAGVTIRFDDFRAEVVLSTPGAAEWRSFEDADYTRLQIHLEREGFEKIPKEMMRDAVWLVAIDNRFDSATEWIDSLKWDGVPRVEGFLATYMGATDGEYTRAVSRYMWTAMAGRVLSPGCEAPMVPVFIGGQGVGKTRTVKAMAPALDFYTEMNLADRDVEASRRMRGRLVIELGELRGLHSRDAESIKAFISRTHEEWRVIYKEFYTQFARRALFFGTTNQEEFLADETGERRWLPILVGMCCVEAVQRDVFQLWAEAREWFLRDGVRWADAEKLAQPVHREHKISDPWQLAIEEWLAREPDEMDAEKLAPAAREFLRAPEVLTGAIRMDIKLIGKREEMRVSKILQVVGYERVLRRVEGKPQRVWVRRALPPETTLVE